MVPYIGVVVDLLTAGFGDFTFRAENPITFEHYQKKHEIEICALVDDLDYEGNEEFSLTLQPDGEGLDDQIGLPNKANVLIISENRKLGIAVRC